MTAKLVRKQERKSPTWSFRVETIYGEAPTNDEFAPVPQMIKFIPPKQSLRHVLKPTSSLNLSLP